MTDSTLNSNKLRIKPLQITILFIHIVLMGLGGSIFGLGVAVRPILRIVKPTYLIKVKRICDLMQAGGLLSILSAGLNCFTVCWKLITPTLIAVLFSIIEIVIEMSAIATTLFFNTRESEMVVETESSGGDDMHPWYVLECGQDPCQVAMSTFFNDFMVPQLVLTVISIFLQLFGMVYLARFLRLLQEQKRRILTSRRHQHP